MTSLVMSIEHGQSLVLGQFLVALVLEADFRSTLPFTTSELVYTCSHEL